MKKTSAGDNASTFYSEYVIHFLPAIVTLMGFTLYLSLISALNYGNSSLTDSWNTIFLIRNPRTRQKFRYLIRILYFHRRTTVDFQNTSILLTMVGIHDQDRCDVRVPAKFLGTNQHNERYSDYGIIKFVLVRDAEFQVISKIALTHDAMGQLNVSMVTIQDAESSHGYISCVEQCITSMPINRMLKDSCFRAVPQSDMELEGEFTVPDGSRYTEFLAPLYLYLNILVLWGYYEAKRYLISNEIKSVYRTEVSAIQGFEQGICLSFWVMGVTGLLATLFEYNFKGVPWEYLKKLAYIIAFACSVSGLMFGFSNVLLLDSMALQNVVQNWTNIYHFLLFWYRFFLYGCLSLIYCIPMLAIYLLLFRHIF